MKKTVLKKQLSPQQIDAILPQTQCGLCTYKGCMPYAEALSHQQAPINLCPPGGIKGLLAIAELVQQDPTPYLEDMKQKEKKPMIAVIREGECIGCTKCIQACPVDAIIGSGKSMHTVITDECTGCELCVAPCPVDCIDMIIQPEPIESKADRYRQRYLAREKRLSKEISLPENASATSNNPKEFIQAVLMRAKLKKLNLDISS